MATGEMLTVAEVAKRLKVNVETVRRWLRSGRVKGVPLGDRAGWRIPKSELQRLSGTTMWRFHGRQYHDPEGRVGELFAYWEVESDPISDDYTTDEISAQELLDMWVAKVAPHHPDGLIPITWHVEGPDVAVGEVMPFQYEHFEGSLDEDFLTFFTWPVNAATGARLNWFELPVVDKLWRPGSAEKGGFIQEATGWKPSILQPFLYLPSLLNSTP